MTHAEVIQKLRDYLDEKIGEDDLSDEDCEMLEELGQADDLYSMMCIYDDQGYDEAEFCELLDKILKEIDDESCRPGE